MSNAPDRHPSDGKKLRELARIVDEGGFVSSQLLSDCFLEVSANATDDLAQSNRLADVLGKRITQQVERIDLLERMLDGAISRIGMLENQLEEMREQSGAATG